jgi:adenylate cyclase
LESSLHNGERRLAAIMFTDMVGYTSLSERNEALAMELLEEHRKIVRPFFPKHNGREVKTIGDAFLVEFASAVEAVRCAFEIQQSMHEMNSDRPPEKQIRLRVGVHVGDVIHSKKDVYGDAVNVASRIEHLATPGGICVSEQVYDHVKNKFEFPLSSLGKKELRNVSEPTEVFRVVLPWEQPTTTESPALRANRIAILPFASFSPDPQDDYFADGMTEEVISTLSKVGSLEVISRTSVMQYKKTPKSVKEVSRELDAGIVLEGSVRKAGNRLRITVQMVDAAKDKHLWAESYDRDFQDVFAIQSDIAGQVANALSVRVLPGEKTELARKPTGSTIAYTLYLKGRYLWNKRGGESGVDNVKEAAKCFEQAVKEDPGFALGYVGLADCYLAGLGGHRSGEKCDCPENEKALVAKALELDPMLAEAHATNGLVLMGFYDLRQAEAEFRKAIELKPNHALARQWHSYIFFHQLRWKEALEENEKATEIDPLSPETIFNQAHMYYHMKDYGKALELFKRVTTLDPGYIGARWMMAHLYRQMRMPEDTKREIRIYANLVRSSYPLVVLAEDFIIALAEDDKQAMRRLALECEVHFQEAGLSAYNIANTFFDIGENDKGFEWLERSYSWRERTMLEMKCDQEMDKVRTDPRYLDLLKRLGLS